MAETDDNGETREQYEYRIKSAEKAHERRRAQLVFHGDQIDSFSNAAMKAPALVAAGGVAAALGFYSANYIRLVESAGKLELFNEILLWLFTSLLLTVAAPGLAYFSQIAYQVSISNQTFNWDFPYTHDTKWSKFYHVLGDCFRWAAIIVVMGSIGCLIVGGVNFLSLVK
jgi:hypothetical protein